VNEFLQSVADEHRDQIAARSQTLNLTLHPSNASVLGDRDLLAIVLRNLVDNANKYCPDGAVIEISAQDEGAEVCISVRDNGPGIAPEHQDRIFERFYRVDTNRSRELGGTGLGLAIAKHIVEAHDSRIVLESQAGQGARFSFTVRRSS
jgi:signal transduction histidine kinase